MLLSMTGYGGARAEDSRIGVTVEVRTVNNRYLKISIKCSDGYATLEGRFERLLRDQIARGTVSVSIRVVSLGGMQHYRLDRQVLEGYWSQLNEITANLHVSHGPNLSDLLGLPGTVVEELAKSVDLDADWPVMSQALVDAIEKLNDFRREEGRSMQADLEINCQAITAQLEQIAKLAPQVVQNYRNKLHERVGELLRQTEAAIDSNDLIREVSIFADRCDINEEITRLRCHLEQFGTFLTEENSTGRKLDFLSQEMFREVNTIGSKANDVEIAHCVVEMKSAVEKIREVLQNVE